jgi:hypothetical protein
MIAKEPVAPKSMQGSSREETTPGLRSDDATLPITPMRPLNEGVLCGAYGRILEWMPSVPTTKSAVAAEPSSKAAVTFFCLFNNAFTFLRVVDRDTLAFEFVDQLISNNGSMNPQGREVVVLLAAVQEFSEHFSCPIVEAELIIFETLRSYALVDTDVVEHTEGVRHQGNVAAMLVICGARLVD